LRNAVAAIKTHTILCPGIQFSRESKPELIVVFSPCAVSLKLVILNVVAAIKTHTILCPGVRLARESEPEPVAVF